MDDKLDAQALLNTYTYATKTLNQTGAMLHRPDKAVDMVHKYLGFIPEDVNFYRRDNNPANELFLLGAVWALSQIGLAATELPKQAAARMEEENKKMPKRRRMKFDE